MNHTAQSTLTHDLFTERPDPKDAPSAPHEQRVDDETYGRTSTSLHPVAHSGLLTRFRDIPCSSSGKLM